MMDKRISHRLTATFALFVCMTIGVQLYAQKTESCTRIGIAWQPSTDNNDRAIHAILEAGGIPVLLDQIRPAGFDYLGNSLADKYVDENGILLQEYADVVKRDTYHGSTAEVTLQDIQAVVFLGGGDLCPTLFSTPEPWHGIEAERAYDVTRDLSEYLTIAYCLDHDIPILGLCRGMQLLAVVSGAPLIQDLGTYFHSLGKQDHYIHRSQRNRDGNRNYTPHDVVVTDRNSLLYSIVHCDTIRNVPSWHHQAVGDITGTALRVTAITLHDDVEVIEAIERGDKTFALGVQYHPEIAVRKHLDHEDDAWRFMSCRDGAEYFRALIKHAHRKALSTQ